MKYDFSKVLNSKELVLQDFIDSYTACVNIGDAKRITTMIEYYKRVFTTLESSFNSEDILKIFKELAEFKISNDIPYIIMSNEIYGLKNLLIRNVNETNNNLKIIDLLSLFQDIDNSVARIYLVKYIDKLISLNNIRRNSLADLVEMNIIQHYESHLIWLTKLAQQIKTGKKDHFPELDDTVCEFGIWLDNEAKSIIQNNSKYDSIKNIHRNLHLFAKKIFNILDKDEYHILITYLEKCELISLSIGTELALLDNILINKKITKDTLTGALNRQGLKSVFQSQYDLSLATSNPFILAMCDLDLFKNINDTYGHVAGDKLLKLFVDVVKSNIRNSDVIVRYGGEEFIIMLPTINKTKGYEVLNKIRKAFEESSLEFNGETIKATVSIGMMEIEPEYSYKHSFVDEYIMIVDQKLYMAKDNGRNRVEKC